jgi:hypothetical protein
MVGFRLYDLFGFSSQKDIVSNTVYRTPIKYSAVIPQTSSGLLGNFSLKICFTDFHKIIVFHLFTFENQKY